MTPEATISINSTIIRSLYSKEETDHEEKWFCIACIVTGIAIFCLLNPAIFNPLAKALPFLKHLVGFNLAGCVGASVLATLGIIDLATITCKKRAPWRIEDNLIKLYRRKRGELLTCEKGQIKTMGIFQRVLYSVSPAYRKKNNHELKETIELLTSRIKLDAHSSAIEKEFILNLFLEKMAPLSRKIYKRKLDDSILNYLNTQIEQKETLPADASNDFIQKLKLANIWARLGNYKKTAKGSNGSYTIIEGASKRRIGIFKPRDQESLTKNNPYFWQKIKYVLAKTILRPLFRLDFDTVAGKAFIAEEATKKVERHVVAACKKYYASKNPSLESNDQNPSSKDSEKTLPNLEFVPDTHIVKMPLGNHLPYEGSFQLWIQEKHQNASQFLGTTRNYHYNQKEKPQLVSKLSDELFDMMVIIDYVTGNFDRHGDNWLVLNEDQGIRLIDGGWAMAPYHCKPWHLSGLKNQYLWKKLPFAENDFTDLGKFVIDEISKNAAQLENEIVALYAPWTKDGTNRAATMKERIQVLDTWKNFITKRDLAGICTQKKIRSSLSTYSRFS
jgi:hypothetical protein